jgi:hypothetical protein
MQYYMYSVHLDENHATSKIFTRTKKCFGRHTVYTFAVEYVLQCKHTYMKNKI